MTISSKQGRIALAALVSAAGLAGCGEVVSTNKFKGAEHEVAARISNFQKHVEQASQKKICSEDLAAGLVARIDASGKPYGKDCEAALKEQLKNVEDETLTVDTVTVHGKDATAGVKSVEYGKSVPKTLTLVKEANGWKISGV